MATKANWGAKHGPAHGALNASIAAALYVLFADMFGANPYSGILVGVVVAACAYGAARHAKLHRQSAAWRAAAWLLVGCWTAWACTHEATLNLPFYGPQSFWWAYTGTWAWLLTMFLVAAVGGKWLAGRPEDPEEIKARETRRQQLALAQKYNSRDDTRENNWADKLEYCIARTSNIGRIKTVKVADYASDETGKTMVDLIDPRTGKPVRSIEDGVEIFHLDFWTDDQGREARTWNEKKRIWENNGFTFAGVFPEGGHSWKDLNGPQMANDLRLPPGCTVRFVEGDDRGSFRGHVQLVNVLALSRPYPTDFTPKSVTGGVHIGYEEHGREERLNMLGHNTTNAGAPESGKTNVTNVVGLRLAETYDSVIFDYDIAGGGVSAPFLPDEWLAGDPNVPQPGVAAAAPNVEIAWLLSTIGVLIVPARKSKHNRIKRDGMVPVGHCLDTSCACPSKGVPLIMHRVDEGKSLYDAGGTSGLGGIVRANLERIAGEGRPARCRVFFGALGSTDEYIPLGVQRTAPNRIALAQPDENEIGRFLGWGKGFDPDIFNAPGNAAVRSFPERLAVVKLLHLSDEATIRRGVVACSQRRPVLDKVSEEIANGPILIEHPDAVAYFRGKIGVTENGRNAQNDGHWIWDGTLTIQNFWTNRWLFILPEIFGDRYETLMADAMAAAGQTPDVSTTEPATEAATTAGGTPMSTSPDNTAAAIHRMKKSEVDLAEALAAGEAAAQEADRRHAERVQLVGEVQGALDGQSEGDPVRTSTDTMPDPDRVVIPETVGEMFTNLDYRKSTDAQAPRQPARAPVGPQNVTDKLAGDPERQRILVLGYIVEAGVEGVSIGPLMQKLFDEVSRVDGGTVYSISEQAFRKSRLERLSANELIHQPYANTDEDLLAPDGGKKSRWVATDKGVQYWEKNRGRVGK